MLSDFWGRGHLKKTMPTKTSKKNKGYKFDCITIERNNQNLCFQKATTEKLNASHRQGEDVCNPANKMYRRLFKNQ